MKDFYLSYTGDDLWLIREDRWERDLQKIRESQFALGNGYLGTRGILEEVPYDAVPGTYLAGVFDKMGAQVSELVNLPNPVNFKFSVEGEKFDVLAMDCLEHKRVLNMKKALLARHTVYRDSNKRRYDYQSLRFVSMHDRNVGAMQIVLTALDDHCTVEVNTGIETGVANVGMISEGRKRHFRVKELGQYREAGYLTVETLEKKHQIVYWSGFYYEVNGRKMFAKDNVFSLHLRKNEPVVFTKVFRITHLPCRKPAAACRRESYQAFHEAFRGSFSELLERHIGAWDKLWKRADVVIEGTANLQNNLRFNIYHMLIVAHADEGFSSIGARTMSGEGYHGHIFWDAEIFLLPFYLFTFPRVAKNLLLYRCRRIEKAKELARAEGYRGAKFPWESADTGDEETPEWARDIDRTIIRIYTHRMEHHITSDIAYAAYKYYVATGDEEFMRRYGYGLMLETARFWASRAAYNRRKRRYEINGVIGPDEFHIDVDNNAYTNMMAKWNLVTAYRIFRRLKKGKGRAGTKVIGKTGVTEKEASGWKAIAAKMALSVSKKKVVEEFDGYFRLKKIIPDRTDENGVPLLPSALKAKDLGKTQLVKQADVMMLLYLLDDVFSAATKRRNYDFYSPRTVHKSSLSPSVQSLMASEVGDLQTAYNFFNVALRADISNLFGNTNEGIHAASLGGTWQAVVFGFAGVKIVKERLAVDPRMPRTWRRMIFTFVWRSEPVRFELDNETVRLRITSPAKREVRMTVFGKPVTVRTNRTYTFRRRLPSRKEERYHY